MNVQFEGIGQDILIDSRNTTSYGAARQSGIDGHRGYTLDISGAVTDNSAYAGHGKTTEDMVCDAMVTETALQSQYLTVMSNSASGADFEKLAEDGFRPDDTDAETAVTVVDEIKAVLAESGTVISGYNDDLSPEVLERITGDKGRAQQILQAFHENDIPVTKENVQEVLNTLQKAEELSAPNDGMVKYLLGQEMDPTVHNLYLAQHSGGADNEKQSYGYYDQNGSGYYAKRAQEYDWETLREPMEKVIRLAGMEPDEESMRSAKFLIEEGVPLTAENLRRLSQIRKLAYPLEEETVIRAAAAAIADGKSARQANPAQTDSAWKQAVYWKEETDAVSEEALRKVYESGDALNLRNLSAAQREITAARQTAEAGVSQKENDAAMRQTVGAVQKENDAAARQTQEISREEASQRENDAAMRQTADTPQKEGAAQEIAVEGMNAQDAAWITAKRQLEEVRLQMTIAANHALIKRGYAIDTAELSRVVEALKTEEERIRQILFKGTDAEENIRRGDLFEKTLQAREALQAAPAALAGRLVREDTADISTVPSSEQAQEKKNESGTGRSPQGRRHGAWTLGDTAKQADLSRRQFGQAGERYEELMTKPRRDLGDSIQKAFRNVDDLLAEAGLEINDANRRAVRILGYNHMEITPEQIGLVKEADLSLQRVTDKMTPASVLEMIREGKNPLEMTLEQLEQYFDEADRQPERQQEKYSEYVNKLERAGQITPEEKESYIGIYRLFRQIEKSDGAVIGSLVRQGAALTMKNLLSAVRTGKNRGIDLEVSDTYGALRSIARQAIRIDDQIMTAYEEHVCREIYDRLDPQILSGIDLNENPSVEQLLEKMREAAGEGQAKEAQEERRKENQREAVQNLRSAADIDDENIRWLLDAKQPVTAHYLAAAYEMRTHRNKAFRMLFDQAWDEEDFARTAKEMLEKFTDEESAEKAYDAFTESAQEMLEKQCFEKAENALDVKAYQLIGKQLALAAGMVRERQYRVPVEIDGTVTALDITIRQGQEKGCVQIATEHEAFGKAGAWMEMTNMSSIGGYLVCSEERGAGILAGFAEHFAKRLDAQQISLGDFQCLHSEALDLDRFAGERRTTQEPDVSQSGQSRVRTSSLYLAARAFVAALQDTVNERKGVSEG